MSKDGSRSKGRNEKVLEGTNIIYQIHEYTRKSPHVFSKMHIKKENK